MTKRLPSQTALLAAALLLLAACSTATPAPAAQPASPASPAFTATPAPTSTPRPTNTPAPTPTPTPITGAACLKGKWQVTDPAGFVAALTTQTKANAQVLNDAGPITYEFKADGTARITADQFKMKMKVPVSGFPLNLDVTIDGEATASYAAPQSDQIKFSNAQLDGLKVSANAGKQQLFSGTATEMADMFGVSLDQLFNTSMYDCREDTFKYTAAAGCERRDSQTDSVI